MASTYHKIPLLFSYSHHGPIILQQQLGTLNNESQIILSFQTEDLLLDSQMQDKTEVNANIQRNQSHTSRAIMMAKKKKN